MASEGHRHATITADDRGAVLQIVAWFLMVVMILTVSLRLLIRFTTTLVPGLDDAVALGAMLCGIAQTIAISLAVNQGVGRRLASLNQAQILGLEKATYASTIFYLLTLSLTKMSSLIFDRRLIGVSARSIGFTSYLNVVWVSGAVVLLWTIASIFGFTFQCALPRPWDYLYGKCFSPIPFWDIIGAVDIVTDIVLIVLPTWVIWTLHMSCARKIAVSLAFSFRFIVIAAAVTRLVYFRRLHEAADPPFESLGYYISTQWQENLSIIVACSPILKPFLDRADSGMLTASIRPSGATSGNPSSYLMQAQPKGSGEVSKTSGKRGSDQARHEAVISSRGGRYSAGVCQDNSGPADSADADQMISRRTTDWFVQHDNNHHPQDDRPHPAPEEHPSQDLVPV